MNFTFHKHVIINSTLSFLDEQESSGCRHILITAKGVHPGITKGDHVFSLSIKWEHTVILFYFIYLFIYKFIYLFLAVLGLRFCARAFSSCGERGPLFIVVRGPLTIAASLVAEHRLQTRRLSSCGSRAQLLRGMWDLPRPGLEPVPPALAGRFSTTAPPGKPHTVILKSNPSILLLSCYIPLFHLCQCVLLHLVCCLRFLKVVCLALLP